MFYMVLICTPICTLVLIKCMETWRFLELESWTEMKLGGNPNRSKQGWGNLVFKKIIVWTCFWYFEMNWASAIFSIWVSVQHHIVSLEMWQQLAASYLLFLCPTTFAKICTDSSAEQLIFRTDYVENIPFFDMKCVFNELHLMSYICLHIVTHIPVGLPCGFCKLP